MSTKVKKANDVSAEPLKVVVPLFKDLVEVLKAKSILFVPFYGALIGFLISKDDYVRSAPVLVQLLFVAALAACTLYAYVLMHLLT